MPLREYKRILRIYKAIKDRKIVCMACCGVILLVVLLWGISVRNRLFLLKKENVFWADNVEHSRKNLALIQKEIREKEVLIEQLEREKADLKSKNNELIILNAVKSSNAGGEGEQDASASENTRLAAENDTLKTNAAKLQSRVGQLEQETATLIKEKIHMEETYAEQGKVAADVSYLKIANAGLVAENARLKKQVQDLQVSLVRIFEQSSSSQ